MNKRHQKTQNAAWSDCKVSESGSWKSLQGHKRSKVFFWEIGCIFIYSLQFLTSEPKSKEKNSGSDPPTLLRSLGTLLQMDECNETRCPAGNLPWVRPARHVKNQDVLHKERNIPLKERQNFYDKLDCIKNLMIPEGGGGVGSWDKNRAQNTHTNASLKFLESSSFGFFCDPRCYLAPFFSKHALVPLNEAPNLKTSVVAFEHWRSLSPNSRILPLKPHCHLTKNALTLLSSLVFGICLEH